MLWIVCSLRGRNYAILHLPQWDIHHSMMSSVLLEEYEVTREATMLSLAAMLSMWSDSSFICLDHDCVSAVPLFSVDWCSDDTLLSEI